MILEGRGCVSMVFLGPAKQDLWVSVLLKKPYLLGPVEESSYNDLMMW